MSIISYNGKAKFIFDMSAPPENWNDLKFDPTVRVLELHNNDYDELHTRKMLRQLAFSIGSSEAIKIEEFRMMTCYIDTEIGLLCAATQQHWRQQLLTLEFERCHITKSAAETLQLLLERNWLGVLSFENCSYDDGAAELIQEGLATNRSLTKFVNILNDVHPEIDSTSHIVGGVADMLRNNTSLVELGLDITGPLLWELGRGAIHPNTNLAILRLSFSETLQQDDVGAILIMCLLPKLKQLILQTCTLGKSALEFLFNRVSSTNLLSKLSLLHAEVEPHDPDSQWEINWSNLQVQTLELSGPILTQITSSPDMTDSIANNHYIKTLILGEEGDWEDDDHSFKVFCDTFRENRGPPEMVINGVGLRAPILTAALQQNTSLRRITVADIDPDGLVPFAQSMANMPGLGHLVLKGLDACEENMEDFLRAMRQSMELNSTLRALNLYGINPDNDIVKLYLPRIQYLVDINRVGRNSLMTANIPLEIWAHVLGKSSVTADGIYFALTNKPELIATRRRHERSMKRTNCEAETVGTSKRGKISSA